MERPFKPCSNEVLPAQHEGFGRMTDPKRERKILGNRNQSH